MNVHADLTSIRGTVVAIAPAPAANRSGKIKLQSGEILYAFPEKLTLIQNGGAYDFGVEPYDKGGKQFLNVKSVRSLEPIRPNSNFVGTDEVLAQRRPTAQAQPPRQQQAEQPVNGAAFKAPPLRRADAPQRGAAFPVEWQRPTHPRDSKRMFICANLGKDIEAGRVGSTEDDYAERIAMWARLYDRTLGLDDPE